MTFWQELRRRQMFRLTGLYIVGAWLVIQVVDILFPVWGIPETAIRYLIYAAFLCFPIALVFGWIFDVTKEGIFRTKKAGTDELVDFKLQKADYGILVALIAISLLVLLGSAEKIQEQIDDVPEAVEIQPNSVAVLPFDNLDDNPDTGYFSDGVSEDIRTQLARLGTLDVMGRTTSFAFRNVTDGPARISRQFGVSHILTGSVRRDRDLVRISTQLLDHTGKVVWAESFDRVMTDIFELQSEVATSVSRQIAGEIAPAVQDRARAATTIPEVYDAYLYARELTQKRPTGWERKAAGSLEAAIELDPDYAPAYALLSIAYVFGGGPVDESGTLALRAYELDPDLAEANTVAAGVYKRQDQMELALELYRRAIEIDPTMTMAHAWFANTLRSINRFDEAREVQLAGLEIDPLNPVLIVNVALEYVWLGEYQPAEDLLLRAVRSPNPADFAWWWLEWFYTNSGGIDNAIHSWKQAVRQNRDLMNHSKPTYGADTLRELSGLYLRLGMFAEADYWHEVANTLQYDEFLDTTYEFQVLMLQHRTAEARKLLGPFGEVHELQDDVFLNLPQVFMGQCYVVTADFEQGIRLLEPSVSDRFLEPGRFDYGTTDAVRGLTYLAYAYQQQGRNDEAETLLNDLESRIRGYASHREIPASYEGLALVLGLSGNFEDALQALDRAIELGWIDYYEAVSNPMWAHAFPNTDLPAHLAGVKVEINRQRAIVEVADAEDDFKTVFSEILAELRERDE